MKNVDENEPKAESAAAADDDQYGCCYVTGTNPFRATEQECNDVNGAWTKAPCNRSPGQDP